MDAGDRIEMLTKAGKLSIGEGDNNGSKKSVPMRKKESEVNQVHHQQQWTSQYTSPEQTPSYQVNNIPQPYNYTRPPHTNQPRPYVSNHTNPPFHQTYNQNRSAPTNAQAQPNRRPNTFFPNLPPFPKLAISNAELFQQLVDRHLLAPYPVRPIESNFPHWYNANLTCSYHMDVAGHSIEDCEQFKMAVRKLMACGKLEFEDEVRPDISKNPIPNHNQRINAIVVEKTLVKKVSDLRVSMQCLFDTLKMTGYDIVAPTRNVCDEDEWDLESQCDYHHGQAGHSIENCWGYKARVQVLLNLGVIEVKKGESNYKEVDMVEKVTLRIPLRKDSGPERVTLRVRKPQSFAYESTHMIPWSYEVKVEVAGDTSKTQTSNAVMAGGIAKNGRFYGPSDGEVRKIAKNTEGEGGPIEEVTEKEEEEFLKIMRQSEYDVVEQLRKTHSKISLLGLVMSSDLHRKALLKVLNEAYVNPDGTLSFVSVSENFDRCGLGYEVPLEDQDKCLTRRKKSGGMLEKPIPHINESFTCPVGVISLDSLVEPYIHLSVNSLEEVEAPETSNIRADENDTPLQNWHSEPLDEIVSLK
ncbi:hypothetical protein Lal_00030062 [Lupinus albus]|nr:hypothetical protein Lal_00030062 [Lupinus albus]